MLPIAFALCYGISLSLPIAEILFGVRPEIRIAFPGGLAIDPHFIIPIDSESLSQSICLSLRYCLLLTLVHVFCARPIGRNF